MRQIRNNVFETNSSSMHSLVIRSDECVASIEYTPVYTDAEIIEELVAHGYLNKECTIFKRVWGKEEWYFGRFPYLILSSFIDKFKYACASFSYNDKKLEEVKQILQKHIPTIHDIILPEDLGTDDYALEGMLKHYNLSLEDFLLNKKYIVMSDGDEYCTWTNFIKSKIINLEAIENREVEWESDNYGCEF